MFYYCRLVWNSDEGVVMHIIKRYDKFSLPVGNHLLSYGTTTRVYRLKNKVVHAFTIDYYKILWLEYNKLLYATNHHGAVSTNFFKSKHQLYSYKMPLMRHADNVRKDGWETTYEFFNRPREKGGIWYKAAESNNPYVKLLGEFVVKYASIYNPEDVYFDGLYSEWLYHEETDRIIPIDPFACDTILSW